MEMFKRFEANTQGRDLVVGDIHGCFHVLSKALNSIRFDVTKDRLFSVGDLINRGPYSDHVLNWMAYPWFHAVRGNHEDIAHGAMRGNDDYGLKCGDWISKLPYAEMEKLYSTLDRLPFAFEVKLRNGNRVGILHADIVHTEWDMFLSDLQTDGVGSKLANRTIWNRSRFKHPDKLCLPVNGVQTVYVGHSVVDEPKVIANVAYIDTGCVYGGHLTIVDMNTGMHLKTPYHPA